MIADILQLQARTKKPAASPALVLAERAERNYPDSPTLQQAWINAVQLVRSTKRGWLLDKPITKQERTQ